MSEDNQEPSIEVQLARAKAGNVMRDSRIDVLESAQRFDQQLIEACHHAMTVLGDKSKAYAELIVSLRAEIESLKSDLQLEKENEDRLVRLHQQANNEVYGLKTQVAALIDDQTRLKAEVERLKRLVPSEDDTNRGGYNP
jgi:chromosome segregation ATPase